jgi:hypothetical protein
MDQPINIIAHHVNVSGEGQELRPAFCPPGLDSANFVAVQHDCVVSAPTAECSYLSAWSNSKVRLDSLLKCHNAMAPFGLMPANGDSGAKLLQTKLYEKRRKLSREIFIGKLGHFFVRAVAIQYRASSLVSNSVELVEYCGGPPQNAVKLLGESLVTPEKGPERDRMEKALRRVCGHADDAPRHRSS